MPHWRSSWSWAQLYCPVYIPHVVYLSMYCPTSPPHPFYWQKVGVWSKTRALQSTYPVRCICIYLRATGASCSAHICWQPLPTYATPCASCAHEQKTHVWPAIGTVDRHGQQKRTICDTRGPCQRNRSILKPVFRPFQWIHCAYMSFRCLDLKMWRFSYRRQTTDKTDRFTPCTCTQGKITD